MGIIISRKHDMLAAIRSNNSKEVVRLLDSGVSVNSKLRIDWLEGGSLSASLLYTAILLGEDELAELLLHRGAHPNMGLLRRKFFRHLPAESPLHCACKTGSVRLAVCLLKAGCTVHGVDEHQRTAISAAIENHRVEALRSTLSAPDVHVNFACTPATPRPLGAACDQYMCELVELLLLHGADPNVADTNNTSPLYLACKNGFTDIVTLLLGAGAEVNVQRNGEDWKDPDFTPLHVAAREGYTDIVRLLLLGGADRESRETNGKSALFLACEAGFVDTVRQLLQLGANPNSTTRSGQTPLICSLHPGMHQIQKRLKRLKDLNASGCVGYDSCSFTIQILELLLFGGAAHDVIDTDGYTACDYSILLGQADTTCVLLQHGAATTTCFSSCTAVRWDDYIMCKILLLHSRECVPLVKHMAERKGANLSPSLHAWLLNDISNPPSLLRQCRYSIRSSLQANSRGSVFPLVDTLWLPPLLKDFLKLKDAYNALFT